MQNNGNSPDFPTNNPFSEHFQKFGNTRLFDRLQLKFTPKPFFYQYKTMRAVVLGASFLFHVLSAATAAALIFLFVGKLLPSPMAAGAVTLAALAALEISKRETSGRFFHDVLQFGKFSPGLLAAVLGLAAVSTTCSYFGAEMAVKQLTPPPALLSADTLTAPIRTQIAAIDEQIADAKKSTWKGKLTTRAQRTVERLTRAKEALLTEQIRQQQRADSRNDATETAHTATTEANASGFALFTLACEVLLIFSLWFLQYYDFRSFAEYCAKPTAKNPAAIGFNHIQPAALAANGHSNGNGQHHGGNVGNFAQDTTTGNEEPPRRPIGFHTTKIVYENSGGANLRICEHCSKEYSYKHHKQKYCGDQCRMEAWEARTGRILKHTKTANP